MGYSIVPNIRDNDVVCQVTCEHTDCLAILERWADADCAICGRPMEAGQKFYMNDENKPEHALCVWEIAEKERKEGTAMKQKETEQEEFTDAETAQQDWVDGEIFQLVARLGGVNPANLEWNIEWISEIREAVQDVICDRLKLMTKMEFYPYREI